jgi:hypothetical protein
MEIFLHPPDPDDYFLTAGCPYAEAIRKTLCDSCDFSQERVNKAMDGFNAKAGHKPFESGFLIARKEFVFKGPSIPSPPSYRPETL